MVALDNSAFFKRQKVPFSLSEISLPFAVTIAALAVAVCSLGLRGFSDNGLRLASLNAWRFAGLVLAAALMAGPLGRLAPPLRGLEARSCEIFRAFCASYAVYLVIVLFAVPLSGLLVRSGAAEGTGLSLFILFSALVTLVMALALAPGMAQRVGEASSRALLGIAAIYFWLCYAVTDLAYIARPHRPDEFHGWSLCLLILALLVRFADTWRARFAAA